MPGDIYYADQADARSLRLSFATPSAQQIEEGVARIGRAVSALAR